jgi:hypothetical protein
VKRLIWASFLLAPALLWAQSQTGSISGRVVTATGGVVAATRVSLWAAPRATPPAPPPSQAGLQPPNPVERSSRMGIRGIEGFPA